MIDSVTKFLEKVDQRAGETLGHSRLEGSSNAHQHVAGSAVPASELNFSPLPSDSAAQRQLDENFMAKRDQTLLRLQRDYDELAIRTKEVAAALELRSAEVDELKAARGDVLRDLERARDQLRQREASDATHREDVEAMRAALHEANAAAESARQELDINVAQKRQWELQCKNLSEELSEYKRRTAIALADRESRIVQLTSAQPVSNGSESDVISLRERLAAAEASVAEANSEILKLRAQTSDRIAATASSALEVTALQRREREAIESARVAQAMYEGEIASHQGTRSRLEAVIREKDEEIRLMQKQLTQQSRPSLAPSSSDNVQGDWERRAKELAELVMEKQAALEAKRGETEQWKARFEAAQQRIREMELVTLSSSSATRDHRIIPINPDDKEHGEGLMGEFSRSQFFGTISRRGNIGAKVTTAARHIDQLSLTAGRLLRRSSVLRVCAILYIIALQSWCFLAVFMTSVPQSPPVEVPR